MDNNTVKEAPKTETSNINITSKSTKETQTYLCLGDENNLLEIDLINFREKGQQVRYLSVNFDNKKQQASINLDEKSFHVLKSFFAQLEWDS